MCMWMWVSRTLVTMLNKAVREKYLAFLLLLVINSCTNWAWLTGSVNSSSTERHSSRFFFFFFFNPRMLWVWSNDFSVSVDSTTFFSFLPHRWLIFRFCSLEINICLSSGFVLYADEFCLLFMMTCVHCTSIQFWFWLLIECQKILFPVFSVEVV